jgi:hypothetical protein
MKKRVLIYLLLLTVFAACTSTKDTTTPVDFRGNWVSKDYVENIKIKHSPKTINDESTYYVTEFIIDNNRFGDSIVVYNGQTGYSVLPIKRSGDTLRLKLNKDDITKITYDAQQQTLVFTDKALNRVFRFVRPDSSDIDLAYDIPIAFPTIVNNATFTGFWNFFEHNATQKVVEFTNKGKVKGWGEYTDFSVCTNGNCALNEGGDVVVMTNASVVHAYGFRSKGDTLTVFDLTPRESGGYGMGQPLGLFVRKGK